MVREPRSHKPDGPANIYMYVCIYIHRHTHTHTHTYIYSLWKSLFSQCSICWTVTNYHLIFTLFIRMLLLHCLPFQCIVFLMLVCSVAQSCLTVNSWTVAHQAFLSMEVFSGKNSGLGCDFLLQGIFPTQGLYPPVLCLLHWQAVSLPLSHLSSPVCSLRFKHI